MQAVAPFGDWCGATINTIISPFYNRFAKHALYCFTAGSNVRDHRIETEALKLKQAGVQQKIRDDEHTLEAVPTDQARLWLDSANRAVSEEEANHLLYEHRYRLCGCCYPNFLENYKISKRADEQQKQVKSIMSNAPGDNNITRAPDPRPVESMLVDLNPIPPSRWVILRRALQFIVSNDPNEGIVGMWGPDKDDNTNFLKHINNSFLEQSLFDFVIFVPSPSDCSVTNIQYEIISRLGMKKDGNEATRATRICGQLENKNFLLIVDDLHQNLDLQAVGIPYPLGFVGEKKRKVVIMSLSGYRSVGNLMGVNKDIELPILQEEEARELFRQSINYQGDLYSDPSIGPHATDLVRTINGLPSELVRYGKSMRGTTDASSWKVAIDDVTSKFSRLRSIEDTLRLIEDDPTLGVIGIWGPGGVGKTHLLKKILGFFKGRMTVIWVTASKECSVLKVQTQILDELKLEGDGKGNVGTQSGMIRGFLENKNFLVLLDDLWERIDLEVVGIPLPLGIEPLNKLKRKVVLTTRGTKICGEMEVRKQIEVPYMQENEAWELFRKKVGNQTIFSPGIEDRARILVTEMKGLPLALVTVGRAMYGKFHPDQWDSAIQHMKRSCCIDTDEDPLDMEKEVFRKIIFSYDNLRSERLKNCFLTCALWPEDHEIMRQDLAKCWVGLGYVDEGGIQSSYTKAYSLMSDLTGACLLEGCGELNYRFKLHDVIRDMSLWISCGCGKNNDNWFVRAGVGPDENFSIPWSSAEYISLMFNKMTKLPSVGDPLKLRVLCLQENRLDETIIGGVLVNCAKLTYLDLSHNGLKRIPESLCDLTELIHLNLSLNLGIEEVPHSFGNLIKLKFLYLQPNEIKIIPKEVISRLEALEIIHVNLSWVSDCIRSNVYRELATLNHLKVVVTSEGLLDAWTSLHDAADLPIRSLSLVPSAKKGEFHLYDILSLNFAQKTLCELVIVGDRDAIDITLIQRPGQQPYSFGVLSDLSMRDLKALTTVKWMGTSPASVFPRLTCLIVSGCRKLEHVSWAMYLPCLEELNVECSDSMRKAFTRNHVDNVWSGQENSQTFPCLKHLCLQYCRRLVTIADPGVTFPSLEVLQIGDCPKLKKLPFDMASLPQSLKVLRMGDTESWERLELEEGVKSFLQPKLRRVLCCELDRSIARDLMCS
ncbi:probable disease resistance protein At1g61300 [Lolium perenne]|uniref:probable disease resistance protein At1g61300 n=1 Tax=Lolium perenne TaxID=4522 RepID=UPI0021F68063|nr:disease resistance protein UNI-like [Lolium perenne]